MNSANPIADDIPKPILLNPLKHHRASLQELVQEAVTKGSSYLSALADRLLVLGDNLMDLYLGELSVAQISNTILSMISAQQKLEYNAFASWVQGSTGYQVVTLSHDQSNWVLRLSDEQERYIHIHPGRWSPASSRVRAHTLKTAVMTVTAATISQQDPLDVTLVNQMRVEYLNLSPIREVSAEKGVGKLMGYLLDARA